MIASCDSQFIRPHSNLEFWGGTGLIVDLRRAVHLVTTTGILPTYNSVSNSIIMIDDVFVFIDTLASSIRHHHRSILHRYNWYIPNHTWFIWRTPSVCTKHSPSIDCFWFHQSRLNDKLSHLRPINGTKVFQSSLFMAFISVYHCLPRMKLLRSLCWFSSESFVEYES